MKHAKWCYTCGASLHVMPYIWSYNECTGSERVGYIYECPNEPSALKFWVAHPKTESDAYADGFL